jgi:hypothetical protein
MDFDPRDIVSRGDDRYGYANAAVETVLITIATGTAGGNPTLAIAMMIHANSLLLLSV